MFLLCLYPFCVSPQRWALDCAFVHVRLPVKHYLYYEMGLKWPSAFRIEFSYSPILRWRLGSHIKIAFSVLRLFNEKTNCLMWQVLTLHLCYRSCTGGMFFGPSDSGAVKSVRDTLSKQKIPHEVLKAEDANKRFCALNLPANYVCMLEEGAGILRASVAVQALQVTIVCTVL